MEIIVSRQEFKKLQSLGVLVTDIHGNRYIVFGDVVVLEYTTNEDQQLIEEGKL